MTTYSSGPESVMPWQPQGPSPDERRRTAEHIERMTTASRPQSWHDLRVSREWAAEWLGWSEERLSEVDAILARNDQAKREAATRRMQRERLRDETKRVLAEWAKAEQAKLHAKAEKVARERLGM